MTAAETGDCAAELQEILVRLWTSAPDRADFLADREAWLSKAAISAAARGQLLQLDAVQLETFADGLLRKRLGPVRHLLPGTAARLGQEFGRRFVQWAGAVPPVDRQHHVADATRFGRHLLREPLDSELRDLLRWELLQLRLDHIGFGCGIWAFRHDVRLPSETPLPRRFVLALWWSVGGRSRPTLWLWP